MRDRVICLPSVSTNNDSFNSARNPTVPFICFYTVELECIDGNHFEICVFFYVRDLTRNNV